MLKVVANSDFILGNPVGKSVGKAQEKYPSVVNSLIMIPPIEGHIKVVDEELIVSL